MGSRDCLEIVSKEEKADGLLFFLLLRIRRFERRQSSLLFSVCRTRNVVFA